MQNSINFSDTNTKTSINNLSSFKQAASENKRIPFSQLQSQGGNIQQPPTQNSSQGFSFGQNNTNQLYSEDGNLSDALSETSNVPSSIKNEIYNFKNNGNNSNPSSPLSNFLSNISGDSTFSQSLQNQSSILSQEKKMQSSPLQGVNAELKKEEMSFNQPQMGGFGLEFNSNNLQMNSANQLNMTNLNQYRESVLLSKFAGQTIKTAGLGRRTNFASFSESRQIAVMYYFMRLALSVAFDKPEHEEKARLQVMLASTNGAGKQNLISKIQDIEEGGLNIVKSTLNETSVVPMMLAMAPQLVEFVSNIHGVNSYNDIKTSRIYSAVLAGLNLTEFWESMCMQGNRSDHKGVGRFWGVLHSLQKSGPNYVVKAIAQNEVHFMLTRFNINPNQAIKGVTAEFDRSTVSNRTSRLIMSAGSLTLNEYYARS